MAWQMVGQKEKNLQEILDNFQDWCKRSGIKTSSKVEVTSKGTCHRFGVIATEDINIDEVLFVIPRTSLITPANCSLESHLKKFETEMKQKNQSLNQTSGWIPLLLTLMHEQSKRDSKWAPYLALCPKAYEFDPPMYWSEDERLTELSGVPLLWDIQRDLYNIDREYWQYANAFIKSNPDVMSLKDCNLDLYRHMVGFIMAYSFTEDTEDESCPAMVPMADIFNHKSNNNAHLAYAEDHLEMVSVKPIKKGQEIYNTFGKLGNGQLLQMYGFVEPHPNHYDTVEISLVTVVDTLENADPGRLPMLQSMVSFMRKTGIAKEEDSLVFSRKGLQVGPDMYAVLRILHMALKEFTGLLQDHLSWYRDEYFGYLLQHMQSASIQHVIDSDEGSDDDNQLQIISSIKNSSQSKDTPVVINNVISKDNTAQNEISSENVGDRKRKYCDSACSYLSTNSEQISNQNRVSESKLTSVSVSTAIESTSSENRSKLLKSENKLTSDNINKIENVNTKPKVDGNSVKDSNNSDSYENVIVVDSNKTANTDGLAEKANNVPLLDTTLSNPEKPGVHVSVISEGFSSPPQEVNCEDSDDNIDDVPSLQLTYEQIRNVLPPSWKETMRKVVQNMLSSMKPDEIAVSADDRSSRQYRSYQVRLGYREILHRLFKAVEC